MNKKKIFPAFFIFLFILIIILIYWRLTQSIQIRGIVKLKIKINISLDFPVLVEKIHVSKGDLIQNNQPIITFNFYKLNNIKNQQELEIKIIEYELQEEKNNSLMIQYELDTARENLKYSINKLKAYEDSYQRGSVSEIELEEQKNKVSSNELLAKKIELSYKSKTGSINKNEILNKQLSNIKKKLSGLYRLLEYYNIYDEVLYSPFKKGLVEDIYCTEGDYIDNNDNLITLVDLNSIIIQADVPENKINNIFLGAKVKINPLSNLRKKIYGRVSKISNIAINSNFDTSFIIEIKLDQKIMLYPESNVNLVIYKRAIK